MEPTDSGKELTNSEKIRKLKSLMKKSKNPAEKPTGSNESFTDSINELAHLNTTNLNSVKLGVLGTSSSLVAKKNFFNSRRTTYIPDFFLIFFYMSVFFLSAAGDRGLIVLAFFNRNHIHFILLYTLFSLIPGIYFLFSENGERRSPKNFIVSKFFGKTAKLVLVLYGLDAVFIGCNVLRKALSKKSVMASFTNDVKNNAFYFFHISDDELSKIKIYCLVNTVGKSIPQLFVGCLLITEAKALNFTVCIFLGCILLNFIIFSLTMTITFPIRKHPKILATSAAVIMNSFTKFMATMCACGVTLCVFLYLFMFIGFKAFYLYIGSFFTTLFPCYYVLKSLPNLFRNHLQLYAYTLFFSVIFIFIYIHPFERKGKFLYYYFHLVSLLTEIAAIYLLTDAEPDVVIIYISLQILIIGFKSCCRLTNVLHKISPQKNSILLS